MGWRTDGPKRWHRNASILSGVWTLSRCMAVFCVLGLAPLRDSSRL